MKLLPHALLEELAARAAASPRRRAHYNIPAAPEDLVQRFIVMALQDSYFRPHRHAARAELALILEGDVELVTFDERGALTARSPVGGHSASLAYETPPAAWHTVLVSSARAAFLEIKQGPYDPATSSQFAQWAPAEGDASVAAFQQWLQSAGVGDRWGIRPRRVTGARRA